MKLYRKSNYDKLNRIMVASYYRSGMSGAGYNSPRSNISYVARNTDMYEYYLGMELKSNGYQKTGNVSINVTGSGGRLIFTHRSGSDYSWYGEESDLKTILPLSLAEGEELKVSLVADPEGTWYSNHDLVGEATLVRKKKPGPEITKATLVSNSVIGDNTLIRFRIDTKKNYNSNMVVKATLGGVTKTKTIAAGTSTELEWDSSEIGEGKVTTISTTASLAGYADITTAYPTSLDIKYILKDTTNQLMGQLSPKSSIQRTVVVGASTRHIDSNAKNNTIIDNLGAKLKSMGADVYVIGTDNLLWKRLASKF